MTTMHHSSGVSTLPFELRALSIFQWDFIL